MAGTDLLVYGISPKCARNIRASKFNVRYEFVRNFETRPSTCHQTKSQVQDAPSYCKAETHEPTDLLASAYQTHAHTYTRGIQGDSLNTYGNGRIITQNYVGYCSRTKIFLKTTFRELAVHLQTIVSDCIGRYVGFAIIFCFRQ